MPHYAPVHDAMLGAFGRDVIYTPVSTGATLPPFLGIWRSNHHTVDVASGAVVSSNQPILGIPLASLPAPATRNDIVSVDGVNYSVIEVIADGLGWVALRMSKKVQAPLIPLGPARSLSRLTAPALV